MATATDIAGLCGRIDAGEDDLLPMLADALEEMGDARATSVRTRGQDPHGRATPTLSGHEGGSS